MTYNPMMDLNALITNNLPTLIALVLVYVRIEKSIARMNTNQQWLCRTLNNLPCNRDPKHHGLPNQKNRKIPQCPQT